MKGLNASVKWYLLLNQTKVEEYMNHPINAQTEVFKYLIYSADHTVWGRKYDFKNITSPKEFADRVPLGDYETHKAFINRMMHGEPDLLWPGRIKWFSKSSGTTNDKSKFIPVSMENLRKCHIQGNRDLMSLYLTACPDATIFENKGKGLVMGGSLSTFEPYPKTRYGDVSAIMIENMPSFFKHVFNTPSTEISLMSEWEEKIERMAHETIQENVTNIGGVPTWTLVLFKRILEITGKSNILEVWPNLQVYFHGAVSFEPYKSQFKEFIPSDDMKYFEVYNATEGYFAASDTNESGDMLLFLDNGIFYEFIPMEEWDKDHPKTLTIGEVETGKTYALVISTNAGLWRYQIGDTIEFTSTNPYRIKITGRTKHFINVFGEEVMVANTDKALAMACRDTQAEVNEYTVAPIFFADTDNGKGGHEWLIEFEKLPDSVEQFSQLLDSYLQKINSDYEAKRYKNMALEQLQIRVVPKNTFHNWLKSKGKFGGQHKVPRLSNERKYVEEIMTYMREHSN